MAFFPDKRYSDIGSFLNSYSGKIAEAFASVDSTQLALAAETLKSAIAQGGRIYVCGNGGSAAISNHFCCDHMKGVSAGTSLRPIVHSLSSNIELITAIANDISYDNVFVFQLSHQARPNDILVTVSSSGNSPNILTAIDWAKANGVKVIAMSGFNGGRSRELADVSLHVETDNYGVVEDIHQALMHILAQYLRQGHLAEPETIGSIKF